MTTITTTTKKTLFELIEDGNWSVLRQRLLKQEEKEKVEEEIKKLDKLTGRTILHQLCYKPPVPEDIFRSVLEVYPEATGVREKSYGATPLHVLCWSTQQGVRKVQILLEFMTPDDLLVPNYFGGTALHSACGSNACIGIIRAIVTANPKIVLTKTREYKHTALIALWHSHLQTIPGHMQIARILKGGNDDDNVLQVDDEDHFQKFWNKVIFLSCEAYKLSSSSQEEGKDHQNNNNNNNNNNDTTIENYVLHGLLQLRAPINLYKVAMKRNPNWTMYGDWNGNYPLHNIITTRPYRVKDVEIITELVTIYPQAATMANNSGSLPIFIAIRERIPWESGLKQIVQANPDEILSSTDKLTGLYPYLLAASLDGKVAIETTYQLLCSKPHLYY